MNQWQQLSLAISIVATAFEGKMDRGGKPYILHCLYVMNNVDQTDPELMQIAVMHDLLEDCPEWDHFKLTQLGFSSRVLGALGLLTHDKQVPYEDYINTIALNQDARRVKMADLKHNSCVTRLKGLREKDFARLQKYAQAYSYLSNLS